MTKCRLFPIRLFLSDNKKGVDNMEIRIHALKKCYGSRMALDNLSLTIGNGMTGLLGRNGAGKTTFMQILSTLQKPTSGIVMFGDVPLKNTRQIRSMIGYLPQEFSQYPNLSVMEIMRYFAALSELPAGIQGRRIQELLQRVNLWEDRGKKIRKLSGGMKKRLGVAQALLHDPRIVIADEPTTGLDPQERLRFYSLLSEFSVDRTVIVSSHIVSDIETICENVAVLEAGKLLFHGKTEDLAKIAEGKVYELTVPKNKQAEIQQDYCVLSSQGNIADVKIRVINDDIPLVGNPVLCKATVEDGYMELLRKLDWR